MDLPRRAPICWAGRRLSSSDKVRICCAITLSNTFPSVLKTAMGRQAQEAGVSPLPVFLRGMVLQ